MLTINGRTYAKNDKEFTNTLFRPEGTASGFYKVRKNGVLLMDMQKKPFAFICTGGTTWPCAVTATGEQGKVRYMYGLSSRDGAVLFGSDSVGYREQCAVCYRIAKDAGIDVSRFAGIFETQPATTNTQE